MKKRVHLSLLACVFFGTGPVAKSEITIRLIDTFRYPAEDAAVITAQINDFNDIAGTLGIGAALQGFYKLANGRPSAPFHEPEDTMSYTVATGLNSDRVICGYYNDGVSTKGFIRMGRSYSSFVAPIAGVSATYIYSINDAGSFVGSYDVTSGKGFAVIDGIFTSGLPGYGAVSDARGINNFNDIVGQYSYLADPLIYYGYLRHANGSSISFGGPEALRTQPMAINDARFVVGSWYDGGTTHGFLVQVHSPGTFTSYDVPGAVFTQFTGINNNGTMCGTYYASSGEQFGFIAQMETEK